MENFGILTETLKDHEARLRRLEEGNIRLFERLESTCQRIDTMVSWLKGLLITFITTLLGFFIWYVQQL